MRRGRASRADTVASADPLDALRSAPRTDASGSVAAAYRWRWRAPMAGLLVALWALAVWVDHTLPTAGLWALLGLSLSTGFVHGALDAQLLLQRFASRSRALAVAGLYLVAVLALGATLSAHPGAALFALIAMSAWHFGESYGRWTPSRPALQTLTRVVVGGAPVLLFPWLVSDATASQLLPWLSVDALPAWRGLGLLWLVLFAVWAGCCGLPAWRAHRHAWVELAGIGLLNLSLSPLMAFALYFGAYHAPVHIWRVWRSGRTSRSERDQRSEQSGAGAGPLNRWSVAAVAGLTILLGVMLWKLLGGPDLQPAEVQNSLRWLIVLLAALTLPHLVLISLCARMLSPPQRR